MRVDRRGADLKQGTKSPASIRSTMVSKLKQIRSTSPRTAASEALRVPEKPATHSARIPASAALTVMLTKFALPISLIANDIGLCRRRVRHIVEGP